MVWGLKGNQSILIKGIGPKKLKGRNIVIFLLLELDPRI